MAGSTSRMLDALSDRILIVNREGKVAYANVAARSDFDGTLSALLAHKELREALADVWTARKPTPLRLTLKHNNGTTLRVSLAEAPNGKDAAIVVHAGSADENPPAIEGRTVAELMRQHLHRPLEAFVKEIKDLGSNPPSPTVVEHGSALLERLEKVLDLIAVFGGEALLGEERLLPKTLVEQACQETLQAAKRGSVRIAMNGFDGDLPPVYGSERWMRRAVRELVDNAIRQTSTAGEPNAVSTIEIRARQAGEFLTLQFVNHGAYRGADGGIGTFVPFTQTSRDSATSSTTRIGLPLAQRIVELHGGALRIRSSEDDDSTEVTVQLPTGAPRFGSNQLDTAQVKRYAEDLAKLLARRRADKAQATQRH